MILKKHRLNIGIWPAGLKKRHELNGFGPTKPSPLYAGSGPTSAP